MIFLSLCSFSLSLITFITLKTVLFEINVAASALFELLFMCHIFVHSITFNLKWVSSRQHAVRSCLFWGRESSLTISFLSWYFRLFMFKVFIEIFELISVLLVTVFSVASVLCPSFYPLQLFWLYGFKWAFYMIIISLLSIPVLLSFFNFIYFYIFSDCSRIWNIYLQLIQVHFKIMLHCFMGSANTI